MLKIKIIGILLIIASLFGCESSINKPPVDPIPRIINNEKQVEKTTTDLKDTTNSIEKDAKLGIEQTAKISDEEMKVYFQNLWNNIILQVEIQKNVIIKELENLQKELKISKTEVESYKEFTDKESQRANKLQADNLKLKEDLKSSATKAIQERYIWISVICFAGAIICGIMFFAGIGSGGVLSKISIFASIACAIGFVVSIWVVQTVWLIPWIVGGLFLLAAIIITWQLIAKNGVIYDLVKSFEITKQALPKESRKKLISDGAIPGKIDNIQSEQTKTVVKKVRATIKKANPITVEKNILETAEGNI